MDVREDWREIYRDLWRQERDWFYDPNMHGVDWDGVYDKYMALVERVTTRDELNDVIGRVVGELSALHTRVSGGDVRTGDDNVRVSSLGARIMRTAEGDRIDYIYQTDPDYPDEMSPLADPDLGISAGDVITAVNGRSVLDEVDIGALLRNQTRPVRLALRGSNGGTREVMVTPTTNEREYPLFGLGVHAPGRGGRKPARVTSGTCTSAPWAAGTSPSGTDSSTRSSTGRA